jgi:G:T-mismatch repair DNA endonuclease (very short patch repair protein)
VLPRHSSPKLNTFISGHNLSTKETQAACIKAKCTEEFHRRFSAIQHVTMQKIWDSYSEEQKNDRIRHMRRARAAPSTSKIEKTVFDILEKIAPGEFQHNHDAQVVIGRKVPDIVNVNGRKLFIEVFGEYWHGFARTGRTKTEEEQRRRKHFKKFGFDTLIVWEREIKTPAKLQKRLSAYLC